jgi:hypothetical protein
VKKRVVDEVIVQVRFAELTTDGIGEKTPPIQVTISGADWTKRWGTAHSRRAFERMLKQVDAQLAAQNGGSEPAEEEPAPNRAARRSRTKSKTKAKG